MPITVIGGEQRGDEGKGRFVDMLAEDHDIVARFNGGPNAGHTVITPDGKEFDLHGLPSGVARPEIVNIMGNGVFIDPVKLDAEIHNISDKGLELTPDNLKISSAAHLIMPHHIYADEIREAGEGGQGSTKSGIAQVAADKYMRIGVRAEQINNDPHLLLQLVYDGLKAQREARAEAGLEPLAEEAVAKEYLASAVWIGKFVTDTVLLLNRELRKDSPARVLAEGAQAFLLDIDHGMYPYTTSSSPVSGGVSTGLGVPADFVDRVVGVVKAVQSHVGDGPFVTEITDKELLGQLHGDLDAIDAECGTTTGRQRRLGHLDLPQIRRSQMVNGTQETAITKLDWLQRYGEKIPICVEYFRKGRTLEIAPDSARKLEQSAPQYKDLPGWEEDIQDVRHFADLPHNARKYIDFVEDQTGVPIKMIGVGPQRDQVIIR